MSAEVTAPVPAPTTKEAPKPTNAEAMAFGGKKFEGGLTSAEIIAANEKSDRLRQAYADGAKPDRLYEIMAEESTKDFSPQQAILLEHTFGAWSRNDKGELVVDQNDQEAKLLAEQVSPDIGRIRDILIYTQLEEEAANNPGKTAEQIFSERCGQLLPTNEGSRTYEDVRNNALDALLATDLTGEQFGLKDEDAAVKRDYIANKLAHDPDLLKEIKTRMSDIDARVKRLTEPPKNADVDKATGERKSAEQQRDSSIEDVMVVIDAELPGGVTQDDKDTITKMIKQGRPVDQTLSFLRNTMLNPNRLPDVNAIAQYSQDLVAADELQQKTEDYTGRDPSVTQNYKDKLKVIRDRIDQFELKLAGNKPLKSELLIYKAVISATSNNKDGGFYVGQLAQRLSDAAGYQKEWKKANDTIEANQASATEEISRWRKTRQTDESGIANDISMVLRRSVGKTMLTRYHKLQEVITKDMAKAAEKDQKGLVKKLMDAMNKNWGHYDEKGRRQVFNTRQTAHDIRFVTYHGEDGVRRLMLRDLGFKLPARDAEGNVIRDAQGNALPQTELVFSSNGDPLLADTYGNYLKQPKTIDWETADMDLLSDEDKATFEAIYKEQGTTYKTKLFGDYEMARSRGGLTGNWEAATTLKLAPFEVALLSKTFSSTFESQIERPEQLKQEIRDAEEKNKRGGGLLAILAALAAGIVSKAGR